MIVDLDTVCEDTGNWPLDIEDLLRFSFQVAQGLDFLASKNVSALTSERSTSITKTQQQLLLLIETKEDNLTFYRRLKMWSVKSLMWGLCWVFPFTFLSS